MERMRKVVSRSRLLVPPAGADPAISEENGFTDRRVCRFALQRHMPRVVSVLAGELTFGRRLGNCTRVFGLSSHSLFLIVQTFPELGTVPLLTVIKHGF